MAKHYLACDLGAESGRVMAGSLDGGRLALRELHRFANLPVREGGSLHWNISNLVLEVKEGLRKAAASGLDFASISTDSWGVDYLLFNPAGELMPPAFHYRDHRTERGVEIARRRVPRETIFEETGIQFMPINTIFQLASEDRDRLSKAGFLLGVGDGCNYFLSGARQMEVSMASTFQLYNPRKGNWSDRLISALELPRPIFPEIVPSGTVLGKLRTELALETSLPKMEVIATCSHDTGAAVAGVPAEGGDDWAYLSSGTWSLMGVELPEPIITAEARELNFTNEIGFGNSARFLKNLSGLWIIQECRRQWAREGRELSYDVMTGLASESGAFVSLINPAAPEFLAPENMPRQMAEFCRRTGQPAPASEGAFVRCALESLALLYRRTRQRIERLTGRAIRKLHVVGGGSRNDLLNQFTADALGIPVLAGPAEATAAGNVLIQAITLGDIPSLEAARGVIRNSTELRRFQPENPEDWAAASERFETYL